MFSSNANCASVPLVANIDGNGNNGFLGGDGLWGLIIILALLGWGNGGFGGFGGGAGASTLQGYATQADLMRGFDTSNIVSKLDGITNGLCDGFYSQNTTMLQGFNGLQNTVSNGFNGVDRSLCDLGYQTQNGFNTTNVALMQAQNALQTQLANCCCENREGQAQIRYDMATQACETRQAVQNSTRDIIDNANANNRAILDFLVNDKIATLTAENQSLKFQASQAAQNAFITANQEAQTAELIRRINPMPVPAFTVPAPYAYAGCGNGCGC